MTNMLKNNLEKSRQNPQKSLSIKGVRCFLAVNNFTVFYTFLYFSSFIFVFNYSFLNIVV